MPPLPSLLLPCALAICLLLSSCVSSVNPISSPDTAKTDLALIGDWVSRNGKEVETTRISVTHTPWMRMVSLDAKGRVQKGSDKSWDFFPSILGKDTFFNFLNVDKTGHGPVKSYTFCRYEISQGHILHLWIISKKPVIKAIRSGKLKGAISEKSEFVVIQDSSENIQAFILRSPAHKLFKDDGGVSYKK